MGYGTEHLLTLAKDLKGNYYIVSDEYDESDIFCVPAVAEDETVKSELAVSTTAATASQKNNAGRTLNVNDLIEYADKWVFHGYAPDNQLMLTDYYNKFVYGYYSKDCCNYVSQCLMAGGMINDYNGETSNNEAQTQWWHTKNPGTKQYENYDISAQPWRYVPAFKTCWTTYQGYASVAATASTVFPGNPVLSGTSSHVTICVGYNSAGIPIINGHNKDVYHVPYTMAGGSPTTIQIQTSNLMAQTPANALTIRPTTSLASTSGYISQQSSQYYKFTVSDAAYYTFQSRNYNSSTAVDTVGYLYKESGASNSTTFYLDEIAQDDDSGSGTNFYIRQYLTPGTYYIRVHGYLQGTAGFFWLDYQSA